VQIEFAFSDALFQKTGEDFLPGTKAFLHDGTTKPEIRFKNLMTARSPVDDVGACAVLSHDRPQDSFCGRPFLRRGRLSKVPSVRVESLEPSNKQVFLSLPLRKMRELRFIWRWTRSFASWVRPERSSQ
jgi:hypothetical protein